MYNVFKVLMLCREEYLVCDFSCLLSSIGGYVGLFFGMSIFDLILTSEWMMSYFSNHVGMRKEIKIETTCFNYSFDSGHYCFA